MLNFSVAVSKLVNDYGDRRFIAESYSQVVK